MKRRSVEITPETSRPSRKLRYGAPAAALALSGVLASCSGGASPASAPAEAVPTTSSPPVSLKPDMHGFLEPGSQTTCLKGGARPCAVLLRTEPKYDAPYINAVRSQETVGWPREPYGSYPGDSVAVQCYIPNGQLMKSYEGNLVSADWYKVIVPASHARNPEIKAELNPTSSPLPTIQYEDGLAVEGWASVVWFGASQPNPAVKPC